MFFVFLFIFGAAIGSFLNVVALRYDGDHFVFDEKVIGGRSHCPHCGKTLRWFELIPLVSFVIQTARCRNCRARIGWQYPLVETISGLIFILVPLRATAIFGPANLLQMIIWVIAFEILLLISYIDFRLGIIPDELNIFLGILGITSAIFWTSAWGLPTNSLLGPYGMILGGSGPVLLNRIWGALAGVLFFGFLVYITPKIFGQEGMGMGDVKLALALGILVGWPDIAALSAVAFVVGAAAGLIAVSANKKTMKATLPFGPFLAVGVALLFFFGFELARYYFSIIG